MQKGELLWEEQRQELEPHVMAEPDVKGVRSLRLQEPAGPVVDPVVLEVN